ncbi:hypothetical protein [Mongoliibacter ruber]|uniref:hypothetical protein n=1 Tax=Mongoliibacter ruber TaxID=1750599 RepID=UPI000D055E89|nr:hypothetical protein [Mongoliibacter ruber]
MSETYMHQVTFFEIDLPIGVYKTVWPHFFTLPFFQAGAKLRYFGGLEVGKEKIDTKAFKLTIN